MTGIPTPVTFDTTISGNTFTMRADKSAVYTVNGHNALTRFHSFRIYTGNTPDPQQDRAFANTNGETRVLPQGGEFTNTSYSTYWEIVFSDLTPNEIYRMYAYYELVVN